MRSLGIADRGRGAAFRSTALALLATLAASGAAAQTARLTVLADSVSAGQPFDVAVTVSHAPGAQVTLSLIHI